MNFNDVVHIASLEVFVSVFFLGMCFYFYNNVSKKSAVWAMVAWMIFLGVLPIFNDQMLSLLHK